MWQSLAWSRARRDSDMVSQSRETWEESLAESKIGKFWSNLANFFHQFYIDFNIPLILFYSIQYIWMYLSILAKSFLTLIESQKILKILLFWVVKLVSQSRKSLARLRAKSLASRETLKVRDFSHTITIQVQVYKLQTFWNLLFLFEPNHSHNRHFC